MQCCDKCGQLLSPCFGGGFFHCHCRPYEVGEAGGATQTVHASDAHDAVLRFVKQGGQPLADRLASHPLSLVVNNKKMEISVRLEAIVSVSEVS